MIESKILADGKYHVIIRAENNHKLFICVEDLIMSTPATKQVEHINGDTLDNMNKNLRLVPRTEKLEKFRVLPS